MIAEEQVVHSIARDLLLLFVSYVELSVVFGDMYLLISSEFYCSNTNYCGVDTLYGSWYYSVITLTTVGYGDIVPISNRARILAACEALAGVALVGLAVARLIGLLRAPSEAVSTGKH